MKERDPYNDENEDSILRQLKHLSCPTADIESQRSQMIRTHAHWGDAQLPEE